VNPDAIDPEDDTHGIGISPLLVSLMPFALLFILYFVFPSYGAPAFSGRGLPSGMLALAGGLLWGAFGVYLVSESDSYGKAIAVMIVCTLPASYAVVMAPWMEPI
jgi:hypothetical protein